MIKVVIVTDPTGPPFVFPPELDDVVANGIGGRPGQVVVRIRPASEEYGPISHYWLIIVPGNYSKVSPSPALPRAIPMSLFEGRRCEHGVGGAGSSHDCSAEIARQAAQRVAG